VLVPVPGIDDVVLDPIYGERKSSQVLVSVLGIDDVVVDPVHGLESQVKSLFLSLALMM